MVKKLLPFLVTVGLFMVLVSPVFLPALPEQAGALEKVKLSSAVKFASTFYLPIFAGEEGGFWKDNGLEVEWVPFASGTAMMHAVAARAVNIGMHVSTEPPAAAERGLPVVMVAELIWSNPFLVWVKSDSPYRQVQDLKGKRIGVTSLGAAAHAFGRIVAKAHGIEKDVRFIGAGGVPEILAGLRVGSIDAVVLSIPNLPQLKVDGIIREVASLGDYLPKPWVDVVIFARKDYGQSKPEIVRRTLKAVVQSSNFIQKNPRWSVDKMKSFQGLSEEAAKAIYETVKFTTTGRLDRRAVENIRRVLVEYAIITEKAPKVDDLFTNEYLLS